MDLTRVHAALRRCPDLATAGRAVHDALIPPAVAAVDGLHVGGFVGWRTEEVSGSDLLGTGFGVRVGATRLEVRQTGTWELQVTPDAVLLRPPPTGSSRQLRPQVRALAEEIQARLAAGRAQAALRWLRAAEHGERLAGLLDELAAVQSRIRGGYAEVQAVVAAAGGDDSAARTWATLRHGDDDPADLDRAVAVLLGRDAGG